MEPISLDPDGTDLAARRAALREDLLICEAMMIEAVRMWRRGEL